MQKEGTGVWCKECLKHENILDGATQNELHHTFKQSKWGHSIFTWLIKDVSKMLADTLLIPQHCPISNEKEMRYGNEKNIIYESTEKWTKVAGRNGVSW